MTETLQSISALAVATPLGLLVALLVVGIAWSQRQLGKEREVSKMLVSEMLTARALGASFSPRADETIEDRDRRKTDKPHDPNRRKETGFDGY